MAIEKQSPVISTADQPTTIEEKEIQEIVDLKTPDGEQGFEILEDGSAVPEEDLVIPEDVGFDGNLAEVIEEDDLQKISSDIVAGIESDKAPRS